MVLLSALVALCIRFPRFYPLSPQIRKSTIAETVGGDNSVPTFTPSAEAQDKKPSKRKVAAIVGGIGAALLVVVTGVTVCFCLMRLKRLIRRASDTASSVPSPRGNSTKQSSFYPTWKSTACTLPFLVHMKVKYLCCHLIISIWTNLLISCHLSRHAMSLGLCWLKVEVVENEVVEKDVEIDFLALVWRGWNCW